MELDNVNYGAKSNFLRKLVRKYVPRRYSFLICISLRPGCALIGLLSIILPIIDIVQISRFLYNPSDESEDSEGVMKCPNQWYLKTSPISPYAIFSPWPFVLLHLIFAVIYFVLSLTLIAGVTWKSETVIFCVLIGAILVYLPSAIFYLLEIITSYKSSISKVATWIFFFSPLIWLHFVFVVHGYVHQLETLRLIREGVLVKPSVFSQFAKTPTKM